MHVREKTPIFAHYVKIKTSSAAQKMTELHYELKQFFDAWVCEISTGFQQYSGFQQFLFQKTRSS